jgi:quercetin dioxygenase-like cupin family protein
MTGLHFAPDTGEQADLGIATMRVVAATEITGGSFACSEFRGRRGAWTVPHVHTAMEESFYVLEGNFAFTLDGSRVDASPGSFILVPRGTPHSIEATSDAAAVLTLFVPGGLEEMFLELSRLGPEALTDPAVRAEIGKRFDSKPV